MFNKYSDEAKLTFLTEFYFGYVMSDIRHAISKLNIKLSLDRSEIHTLSDYACMCEQLINNNKYNRYGDWFYGDKVMARLLKTKK